MSGDGYGTLDHITAGLARLREAVTPGGFEVGEVTLSFDDDAGKVELKVSLSIDAALLDDAKSRYFLRDEN